MTYKTIVLEMLKQRPQMHEQLRKEKKLLATMELYAKELQTSHQAWAELLTQVRPTSAPQQIASEAIEIAVRELEDRLPSASAPDANDRQFLDAAMLFTRNHRTSRG